MYGKTRLGGRLSRIFVVVHVENVATTHFNPSLALTHLNGSHKFNTVFSDGYFTLDTS